MRAAPAVSAPASAPGPDDRRATLVDKPLLERAVAEASLLQPSQTVRTIKAAVKLDRAGEMVAVVKDVGRVGEKAGARAALDVLKVAEGPEDVARAARLAATKGGQTRAIIKLLGRGALVLASGTFNAGVVAICGAVCAVRLYLLDQVDDRAAVARLFPSPAAAA